MLSIFIVIVSAYKLYQLGIRELAMEVIIEKIVALFYLVLGLSCIIQARIWIDLSRELLKKPSSLIFWSTQFLPLGLIVILGHNLWVSDWRVIITIVGWLTTLKCLLYLLFPRWSGFILNWSDTLIKRYLTVGGVIVTAVGIFLTFMSFSFR